jgi:hypothetical protein
MSEHKEQIYSQDSPQFKSNREALEYFTKEYETLGNEYELSGDEFWAQAENSTFLTEDMRRIMTLARNIQMCKYLIEKENDRS